jgi:hypothetical protein
MIHGEITSIFKEYVVSTSFLRLKGALNYGGCDCEGTLDRAGC